MLKSREYRELDNVTKNSRKLVPYSWPYSQPPIINAFKASWYIGLIFGAVTLPLLFLDSYYSLGFVTFDMFCVVGILILRGILIPCVRRNIIKYVASHIRAINLAAVTVGSIVLISSIVRFLGFIVLYCINLPLSLMSYKMIGTGIFESLVEGFTLMSLLGIVVSVSTICFFLLPKDVKVSEYHKKLYLERKLPNREYVEKSDRNPVFSSYTPSPASQPKPIYRPAPKVEPTPVPHNVFGMMSVESPKKHNPVVTNYEAKKAKRKSRKRV